LPDLSSQCGPAKPLAGFIRLGYTEYNYFQANASMIPTASDIASSFDNELEQPSRRVRSCVIAGCIAAVALFLGALAVLFVQWAIHENPNAIIFVQADEPLDDATVTISPIGGRARESLIGKFNAGEKPHVLFHVPAGNYTVNVRNARGEILFPLGSDQGEIRAFANAQSLLMLRFRERSHP
jgi:hypothetical protein